MAALSRLHVRVVCAVSDSQDLNQTDRMPFWSVEAVADVGLGYLGFGVCVMNICCARRSLTMTSEEARKFADALLAAADASDKAK